MVDLNIDILKNDPLNSIFVSMLNSNHFLPVITKPTHFSQIASVNPYLLYYIWSNKVISYPLGILLTELTAFHIKFDQNQKIDEDFEILRKG